MRRIARSIACLAIAVACGCRRGSLEPVTLQCGEKKVAIELWQNGKKVPRRGDAYRLRPAPFVFRLSGDVRWASYFASTDGLLEKKLASLKQPLVFFSGTRAAGDCDALFVHKRESESGEAEDLHPANKQYFQTTIWGMKAAEAEATAKFLGQEFGTTPLVAEFGHFPFPHESRDECPPFYLTNLSRLEGGRIQGDMPIGSINDDPVGLIPRVRLLLFIESPLGQDFQRVIWTAVSLDFHPAASAEKPPPWPKPLWRIRRDKFKNRAAKELPAGISPLHFEGDLQDPKAPKLEIAELDLNQDGTAELITAHPHARGTGGTPHIIYRRQNQAYKAIGHLLVSGHLSVLKAADGYFQIMCWSRCGGMRRTRTLYRFDGKEYRAVRIDDYEVNRYGGLTYRRTRMPKTEK